MKIIKVDQQTDQWRKLRLGKVTGTRLKKIRSKDRTGLVDQIIAELVSGQIEEMYVNEYMQRGIDYEPLARRAYEERTGMKVEEMGFILHDEYDWLGMSPDGMCKTVVEGDDITVRLKYKYTHGIEIKCPKTSTHVENIRTNKVPSGYRDQILCMFLINKDLMTHDFISYDNRFDVKPLHIVRTTREELAEEIKKMEEMLPEFWGEVLEQHEKVTF